jgi:hypothetical protein
MSWRDQPDLRVVITAWAEGKKVNIKGEDGEWHVMTPDTIHVLTSEKEWVTVREAIERYDAGIKGET